jgi:modification methylase
MHYTDLTIPKLTGLTTNGTGTTGAVAKKLKRNFIGIEKEAEYISLAKKRIDAIKVFFTESDWVEDEK